MAQYSTDRYDISKSQFVSILDDTTLWSAPFGLTLLDRVKYKRNIKLLDVGCGLGFPMVELSQRLGDTCKAYGIDPWKEGNDRTAQKIAAWNIKNVELVEGFAEELPFEDSFFDLVISNNGINNVKDDKKVLSEISRTSKKGAQLLITVNLPETMNEFYSVYKDVLEEHGKKNEIEELEEHIYSKRKPMPYTLGLVEKAGFKIVETVEDEFSYRFTDCTAMFNYYSIRAMFFDSWVKILDKSDVETVFSEVEKRLNDFAENAGGLKLSVPYLCIDAIKN